MMKITIEGPQGCGKSTLARRLARLLRTDLAKAGSRREVVVIEDDGDGRMLKNILASSPSVVIHTKSLGV